MIPDNYLTNSLGFETEVLSSLSDEQKETLKNLLASGRRPILEFLYKNEEDVLKFLKATPQRRLKMKKWNEDGDYSLMLRLSALLVFESASYFFCRIEADKISYSIYNGKMSYRNFAALIGKIILDTQQSGVPVFHRIFDIFPWNS